MTKWEKVAAAIERINCAGHVTPEKVAVQVSDLQTLIDWIEEARHDAWEANRHIEAALMLIDELERREKVRYKP